MALEGTRGWDDEEPIYNIGAVVRMTGIPEATLRVWERRYGFPLPSRTEGSHRLYSQSQVRRLRWVKSRIDSGLQVRQAVEALRRREHGDLEMGAPPEPSAITPRPHDEPSLVPLSERLVAALLAGDLATADQVLGEGLALHPLDELVLHVIPPVLAEIGEAWSSGEASVATEHLASHYLRHRLIMWMLSGPPPYPVRPVVLACAPGELHEGSLLILGVLLRRLRWPVAYLGQSLPLEDLAAFVRDLRPPAVVLVAMTETTARSLADWPHWLPEAAQSGRPLIGIGGRLFSEQPEWSDRVPGDFLGITLEEGLDTLDRWLRTHAMPLSAGPTPP